MLRSEQDGSLSWVLRIATGINLQQTTAKIGIKADYRRLSTQRMTLAHARLSTNLSETVVVNIWTRMRPESWFLV